MLIGAVAAAALLAFDSAPPALAQTLTAQQQLAFDIYKELVEINTVTATGDTARAADAMAARLRAAGFSGDDVQVFKPAPRKGNLVARLRGTGARKPILLLAHLDVVEALPTDWSFDPFKLTEKDGYYYGRGTHDDKYMAATFVSNLIRYKQEGFRPDRDIIVALETDEEILDGDAVGIQWLIKNHRDLIDAEFALNEGGPVSMKRGKPIGNIIQTSEKVHLDYRLEVTNKGGHSALPIPPRHPKFRQWTRLDCPGSTPPFGSVCGRLRARRRRSSPSSIPRSWMPWRTRPCARGSPLSDRIFRHASSRRRRRSAHFTKLKLKNGGRSSRRRTSRESEPRDIP
jgi:hypothetical protein